MPRSPVLQITIKVTISDFLMDVTSTSPFASLPQKVTVSSIKLSIILRVCSPQPCDLSRVTNWCPLVHREYLLPSSCHLSLEPTLKNIQALCERPQASATGKRGAAVELGASSLGRDVLLKKQDRASVTGNDYCKICQARGISKNGCQGVDAKRGSDRDADDWK